jgi:hypothetical protein
MKFRLAFWLMTAAVVCLLSSNVFSQTPEPDLRFSIDLAEVGRAYDRIKLFPVTAWDTIPPFDFSNLKLGSYGHTPNFLKSDFKRTRTDVSYSAIEGYRVAFTYSRAYSFSLRETSSGVFYTYEPRDVSIPGLKIRIESMDRVVERIRLKSFRDTWREEVVASVTSQRRGTDQRRGGAISVDIPLPMPSQLESIFGPGDKTHIDISGREEITFAGESRKIDPFIGVEGQQKQSLFPSLDMEQKLSVTLSGTVGDKVFVQVDHSSDAMLDKSNNIRLWYEGYEDDVIKRVDLGNTNLSLTGSSLLNFSTSSTGLFGVKVLAEVGSTEITVIASKQEGESSGASFSPTSSGLGQTERRVIRDIDYIRNKYFWINDPNFGGLAADPNGTIPFDVWLEINPADKQAQPDLDWRPGKAFYDPFGDGDALDTAAASILAGRNPTAPFVQQDFKRLEPGRDYQYIQDFDTKEVFGIVLVQPVAEDKALAVNYISIADTSTGVTYEVGGPYSQYEIPFGGGAERDTMILELIKAKNPRPVSPGSDFGETWDYMMRNFYNLGLNNIEPASFDLNIHDNTPRLDTSAPTGSKVPYIRIFGLDQENVANQPIPDGRMDATSVYLDTESGILQFPFKWSFAPDSSLVAKWTGGRDSLGTWVGGEFTFNDGGVFQDRYDKSVRMYTEHVTNPFVEFYQYDIVVEAVSTSKTFRIDALNIMENSEKVTIDGSSLSRGIDYDINYDTGEVELKGNALNSLTPDSKVNIDYEFTPFGGGASSSLVGFSTTSKFSQNARLGTIFLYESKGTALDKPRLGEEPTRAIVGGINGQFQHNSKFLTGIANLLPMVDTDAGSSITLSGEIAASMPDPNTRGEAYMEDFEGIEDSDRISSSRRAWYPASLPVDPNDESSVLPDSTRMPIFWYNIEPSFGLHRRDLNPNLNDRENNLVATLDFEVNGANRPTGPSWTGVMTGFGAGGIDLSRGQFLEIWVNDFKPEPGDRGGRLRIDMGRIDEDFYEPDENEWNDEDRDRDGFGACIDDTGLDEKHNFLADCVRNFYPDDTTEGGLDATDDRAGDDYVPQRIDGRFSKVNGTEKNGLLDSEDLDRSGALDRTNSYFSIVVDLADTAVVDIRSEFPGYEGLTKEHHTRDAWRLYRVKLSEATVVSPGGNLPRLDEIRHVRVWIDDVDSVFHSENEDGRGRFQFAELKIVGNRWERDDIRDLDDKLLADSVVTATEFTIGGISTKTDPTRYNPPIVPREENGVFDKEQSMFIKYDNFEPGNTIRIFKQFVGRGMDLTSYRDINFWVHVDRDQFNSDLEYFFRLAFDENNYYEIKFPLTKDYFDPVTGWADVRIRLEDLTGLKLAQSDSLFEISAKVRDIVRTSTRYDVRLKNRPSMFNIRFLYAGLRNVSQTGLVHSGDIWINDIYAGNVRRDIGVAERLGANINIGGGVLSIGSNWQRTDADFRGLRAKRGSGVTSESFNFNAKSRVEHFIPLFGFSIPVSGTYSKSTSRPRYTPSGDTEITNEAVRDSLRSETITRGFSTSLVKKGSQNPLFKYTLDKTTTSFSFSEQMRRSPTQRDTTRTMSGSLNYQINWSKTREIPLWRGIKLGYWPKSMDFRIQATRKTALRNRFRTGTFVADPFFYDAKANLSGSLSYSPLKSLTSSFNGTMARDLNRPHYVYGVDIGRETKRTHSMQLAWKPPPMFLISAFSPDFSYNSSYREDSGPEIRRPGDPSGTRNSANQRATTAKLRFDVGKYFGKFFGFFGWLEDEPDKATRVQGNRPPAAVVDTSGAGQPPAAGDSTQADEPSRPRADPLIAVRKFGGILKDIRQININVQQRFNSRYTRIPARPSLAYQFGVTESSGIIKSRETLDEPDQTSTNLSISFDTGVQITQDLDVATRFTTNLTNSATQGAESETRASTWPDISLRWSGLERFSLFRPLFTNSSANMLYKKQKRETGRKGTVDSRQETLTLSPSMTFTFKNEVNSTLAVSYTKNLTDNRGSITERSSMTIALDLKKDFRGGSGFRLPIPFFSKEVKWTSTLNSNLNISYSRSGGKSYQAGSELNQPIPGTTGLSISPNLTYTFSRAINGRLFVDYGRSYAEASDRTTTTLRIGLSAVLSF